MDLTRGYYDISPEISERSAAFPGDTPFSRKIAQSFEKNDSLLLSSIQLSPHLGAHADAPSHYHPKGMGIAERDLHYYFGPCQVISVWVPRGERILPQHIAGIPIIAQRVLFKTGSFPSPETWNGDFNSFSPELIDELAQKGVILVGLDTPSVDLAADQELLSHQAVWRNNLAILEGLVLQDVPDGEYFLVALPLRIRDADASPVRAILVKNHEKP